MNQSVCSGFLLDPRSPWSLLFAKDVEQDPDFDEGLEDDDLYKRKPPRRSPLLWILIVILGVGIVYWALGPESSLFTSQDSSPDLMSPPALESLETSQETVKTFTASTVPTPLFQEGQEVQLVQPSGQDTLSSRLLSDASGTKPGPLVKVGESLTVLDGEMVGEGWVYQVRTQSGATGWVLERSLQEKRS